MTETTSLTESEIKITISKHLSAKKILGYNNWSNLEGATGIEFTSLSYYYLTQLFNAILRASYFSLQWKVAQIIIILKLNKDPINVRSYRLISFSSYQNYSKNYSSRN